ncbi:hypothetical protein Tco_1430996 [Tanacetum coccineum]
MVEGSEVYIIKESPYVYEMPKNNKSQYVDKALDEEPYTCYFEDSSTIYGEKNVVVENFVNKETAIVDHCFHFLSKDEPRLGAFVEKIKLLKKDVIADCQNPPSKNKSDNLEKHVGVSKPDVVEVNNISVGSTKGR